MTEKKVAFPINNKGLFIPTNGFNFNLETVIAITSKLNKKLQNLCNILFHYITDLYFQNRIKIKKLLNYLLS